VVTPTNFLLIKKVRQRKPGNTSYFQLWGTRIRPLRNPAVLQSFYCFFSERKVKRLALRAVGASAVENDFVSVECESFWGECGEVGGASFYVEDFFAFSAVEVVVVMEAGDFVAGGFGGDFDGDEESVFDEFVDRAVDGSGADVPGFGAGKFCDFTGGEGASCFFEYFFY